MDMAKANPIVVIGAGIGGMSAAIRLRLAGYDVAIYEKNTKVGGKMYQYEADGFRWDTGPSVITMRHVFEDLFQQARRRLDDYLTLLPIDPLTRYFYRDGVVLDVTRDMANMAQQIEALNERDVEGYLRYLAYAAQIHRITGSVFIYDKPPTPASFARVPVQDWLKADPLRTMQGAINSFVRHPHLRQLLGRFATYVGGSPYEAPATLNVISHVELTGGVWYPQGGVYQIAQALEKLALELGVEIHTDCPVKRIVVEDGIAKGIETQTGEKIMAQAVVANADVTTTMHHLVGEGDIPARVKQRLGNYAPSCSGFVMMLGVKGDYPQLAHHNIFFSDDYKTEFDAIFKQLLPANDPTIYVSITSKTDAGHAPNGYENWFILINAPALSERYDWQAHQHEYRDLVLAKLAEQGIDIRDKIVHEKLLTPETLRDMSGAWRGALYGPSANSKFTVFLRPHNRSKHIKGLYFAGGTTHPGGGVPMVTLSGKVAADMVIEDLG
jgi:phytoene desaturase